MLACLLLLQPAYAGAATAEERCLAELAAVPPTTAAVVDVELVVPGIVAKLGAEPFWADIRPISTACRAPGSFPDQYRLDGAGEGRDYVKPIARVRTAGVSGVVFAYMSRGVEETLTGVAAALVEYQPDGTVGRVHKASELLGGEGWARLVTTSFTDQFAERCTQEIDYALYSENGDIVGEREVPDRRPRYCEKVVQFPPRHSPGSPVLQRLIEPGRYREAVLHGPAREVRVIKADEGYFEGAEASQISPGGIVRLREVAAGLVTAELARHEPGSAIPLSSSRVADLRVRNGRVELAEEGAVSELSSLDFPDTHVLASDLTGDGVKDLFVELFPSRSGSCYELWSSSQGAYLRHRDLFCNPALDEHGTLITVERDGPYSRITEYTRHQGRIEWVRRQQPLSPDFSRFEQRSGHEAPTSMVVFLGLPECGEAHVSVDASVRVLEEPGSGAGRMIEGPLRVLDVVRAEGSAGEWVLVEAPAGDRGWIVSSELGDMEAAALRYCGRATG